MADDHPHPAPARHDGATRGRVGLFAALALQFLPSCGRSSADPSEVDAAPKQVVLYYSADDEVARPVIAAFERETGVRVLARGDTEATKTTGLVQKLRTERSRPKADVFWSSEVFQTMALAEEGALAPCSADTPADRPEQFRDPRGRWHAFALRARVIVYNTKRITPGQAPRQMHDLLDPRFKGRIVMARPAFGTTRGHMAALVALWGEEQAARWLRGVRENDLRLVDGNSSVVRAVAMGEADAGLTDADDVWAGQRNRWPVDLVYVRHDLPDRPTASAFGPLLTPNAVSLVAGAPHPEAAGRLIEFLLSERVERMLAESESHHVPVRPALAAEFSRYAVPDPVAVPYESIAKAMDAAMRLCRRELGE